MKRLLKESSAILLVLPIFLVLIASCGKKISDSHSKSMVECGEKIEAPYIRIESTDGMRLQRSSIKAFVKRANGKINEINLPPRVVSLRNQLELAPPFS